MWFWLLPRSQVFVREPEESKYCVLFRFFGGRGNKLIGENKKRLFIDIFWNIFVMDDMQFCLHKLHK